MRRPVNMTMHGREAARNTVEPPSPVSGYRDNLGLRAEQGGVLRPGQPLCIRLTPDEARRRFGKTSRKEQL